MMHTAAGSKAHVKHVLAPRPSCAPRRPNGPAPSSQLLKRNFQPRAAGLEASRNGGGTTAGSGNSTAAVAPARTQAPLPAAKLQQVASQGQSGTGRTLIDPRNPRYRIWRGLLIGAAALSGILIPWELGFGDPASYYDPSAASPVALLDAALVVLFCADAAVSRSVAIDDDELLVESASADHHVSASAINGGDASEAAERARGSRLVLDVLSAVPFDLLTFAGLVTVGRMDPAEAAATAAPLKLLHLARLYRVRWFFRFLEYDQNMSLLGVTVARNLVIIAYLTHWVACGFEAYARGAGYDPNLLVGTNASLFASSEGVERYIYSLYWSITTLAGNEWSDMDAVSNMVQVTANAARASVFLLFNLALGAYILGTLTLLVVKNDERTGRYRDLSANLRTYSALNKLPEDLKMTMEEHLRLSFSNSEASDDQVLSIYPSALRRRILRHLYQPLLRSSYLFSGCPRKFLDALLSSSRLELFKQGVDIVTAGDSANELYLVVAGRVQMRSPLDAGSSMAGDSELAMWGEEDVMPAVSAVVSSVDSGSSGSSDDALDGLTPILGSPDDGPDGASSTTPRGLNLYAGPEREMGVGDVFGELSFFTEIPQMTTVRSLTTVRVLVVSRSAYSALERSYPIASRLVLENLRRHTEEAVAREFPGFTGTEDFSDLLARSPGSLLYSWASPELVELMTVQGAEGFEGASGLSLRQELVISNLVRVNTVISQFISKQDEDRTTEFLYAAARGDARKLRLMMQQGFSPDSVDYDGRTALMLGCARGHPEVVQLLLQAGADPTLHDNLGRTALLEAAFAGHDSLIGALTRYGARIGGSAGDMSEVEVAALLCSCVFESNLPLLRRLIEAGADANSADYDGRTPLHIAAAEGNSVIVRVLVEEGGARLDMRDRWGNTAADEARRVGDMPVCDYLETRARLESEAAATGNGNGSGAGAVAASASEAAGQGRLPTGPMPPSMASVVAAANAARASISKDGRVTVDVGAAVQKVLAGEGGANGSRGNGSNGNGDGGAQTPGGGNGDGGGPSATRANGRRQPPLEPVHKAVAVGHAWSVAMPPGARPGAAAGGGRGSSSVSARAAGRAGRGAGGGRAAG